AAGSYRPVTCPFLSAVAERLVAHPAACHSSLWFRWVPRYAVPVGNRRNASWMRCAPRPAAVVELTTPRPHGVHLPRGRAGATVRGGHVRRLENSPVFSPCEGSNT